MRTGVPLAMAMAMALTSLAGTSVMEVSSRNGSRTCVSYSQSYSARLLDLSECAWAQAQHEMAERFPSEAEAAWSAVRPEQLEMVATMVAAHSGESHALPGCQFRVAVLMTGDLDFDLDTLVHEFKHVLRARMSGSCLFDHWYHEEVDSEYTRWYSARLSRGGTWSTLGKSPRLRSVK